MDELLADEQVGSLSSAGNAFWAIGDQLGTIRDIADQNESTNVTTVTNHRIYSGFGKLISESNSSVDEIFGFTGKALDEDTGLQNNLNRWYDASLGLWISEDRVGFSAGDANLRRYVNNNPINLLDYRGLSSNETPSAPVNVSLPALPQQPIASVLVSIPEPSEQSEEKPSFKIPGGRVMPTPKPGTNPFRPKNWELELEVDPLEAWKKFKEWMKKFKK